MQVSAVKRGYSPQFLAQVATDRTSKARAALAEQERNSTIATLKRRGAPFWVIKTILDAAKESRVSPADLIKDVRYQHVVRARNDAVYLIKATKMTLSCPQIAAWFGRDHTSILHALSSHADKYGLPRLVGYNINRVRAKNRAEQAERRQRAAEDAS